MVYLLSREKQREAVEEKEKVAAEEEAGYRPENVLSLLAVDPMELEIGYSLIPLVDKGQGGDLFERVSMIRRQVALELGIVLPPIRIRDNMQLAPNQYVIKIKGVEVGGGELMPSHYLAMDAGGVTEKVEGIGTREPAWVAGGLDLRKPAGKGEWPVIQWSRPSVLATHLTEVIKNFAHGLLGRRKSGRCHLRNDYPVVVKRVDDHQGSEVLARLLKEDPSGTW